MTETYNIRLSSASALARTWLTSRAAFSATLAASARAPSARASAVAARCPAACASSRLCSASATARSRASSAACLLDLLACACVGPFGARVSGADRGVLLVLHTLLACYLTLLPARFLLRLVSLDGLAHVVAGGRAAVLRAGR